MATSTDDLIALKDEAVGACGAVLAAWESGDLAAAANQCRDVIKRAEIYDAADEDPDAVDIEDYEAKLADSPGHTD
jgi:hypothetical protein